MKRPRRQSRFRYLVAGRACRVRDRPSDRGAGCRSRWEPNLAGRPRVALENFQVFICQPDPTTDLRQNIAHADALLGFHRLFQYLADFRRFELRGTTDVTG